MITNPWKLSVRMGILTANLNGLMSRKKESTDTRLRRAHLVRKMDHHGIQLAGISETHLTRRPRFFNRSIGCQGGGMVWRQR